jgi:hypothetical protein
VKSVRSIEPHEAAIDSPSLDWTPIYAEKRGSFSGSFDPPPHRSRYPAAQNDENQEGLFGTGVIFMTTEIHKETKKGSSGQLIISGVLTTLFFPAIIMLLSGNWRWLEGWIFSLWMDAMVLFSMIYLYLKDPALLAERQKAPGSDNQKGWDKYLLTIIYLTALAWLIIMPLDASRFDWSPAFPLWLKILGGVLLIPSIYLIERTTMENTFLSTLVRI